MPVNILLADDHRMVREGLKQLLEMDDNINVVSEADDGYECLNYANKTQPDIILLDIMLPKINGFGVLSQIRETSNVPVIMLTAMNDDYSQIMSFNEKADDYITKPFSVVILHKRIEALLRRIQGKENTNKWLYKDVEVDFLGFSAKKQGKTVDLKPKEIKLLELLLKYKNQVLTRSQMLDNLWDVEETPLDRVIDVYIKNIRKKLGIDCIITVKGIGYKFEEKL